MDEIVRSTMNCSNFLNAKYCDPRVIRIFLPTEKKANGAPINLLGTSEYSQADSICQECPHFKPKR